MQPIQNLYYKKKNTWHNVYTRLVQFVIEFEGIFVEIFFMKIFLHNTNNKLLKLAIPKSFVL